MSQDGWRNSVELLREPATERRLAAETVTLAVTTAGDLVLQTYARGAGVERFMGDNIIEVTGTYAVAAADVPRVLGTVLRQSFPDTPALQRWLTARGIPVAAEHWMGYDVRPLDEDRLLLEAMRDAIGTLTGFDEGEKMADRFVTWLRRAGITHAYEERSGGH